ncbi:hypothetical protein D9M72_630570 [compost metagenome]
MQVIAGAVERVDHEQRAALAALRATFFAEEAGVREGAAQFLDHRLLGLLVHFAGVVQAVLLDHVDRVEPVHVAQEHATGRSGCLDHDVDDGFLHGESASIE